MLRRLLFLVALAVGALALAGAGAGATNTIPLTPARQLCTGGYGGTFSSSATGYLCSNIAADNALLASHANTLPAEKQCLDLYKGVDFEFVRFPTALYLCGFPG